MHNDGLTISQRVLDDASRLVGTDRQTEYGDAHKNYQRIAALWSLLTGAEIDAPKAVMTFACSTNTHAKSNVALRAKTT